MRIALGQINPTVGDFEGNAARILELSRQAAERHARLIVFPEMALCGYPPRDLVDIPSFLDRNQETLERLARELEPLGLDAIVGYVKRTELEYDHRSANSAALLSGGRVRFTQQKMLLPNYDVFDEKRYFVPAERQEVVEIDGLQVGLTICEDAWNDRDFWDKPRYPRDPVRELEARGIDLLINISASPYHLGKRPFRQDMLRTASRRIGVPAVMVNQVGGNDHLIFDGSSFALAADGSTLAQAASFEEDLVLVDFDTGEGEIRDWGDDETRAVYDALVLGLRDYCAKTGFRQAVVGLSGGIDSAVTATLAVDALGAENVLAVGMPGPYSSKGSVTDAQRLAENLGMRFELISIRAPYEAVLEGLEPIFAGREPDVAEENVQARLRGLNLMALANKFNALTLATGNKSEMAVGYCTLYGDMAGGLAVIADVPKTLVYELSREANRRRPGVIPEEIFTKAPSAELRPDQKDIDTLPPYDVLDPILELYIERERSPADIARELDQPPELVAELCRKVDRNEYKRQQAAPVLRVTSKAFGLGRRFPIAQRFRHGA